MYLDWTESELPQSQRTKHVHGLHPYLGKFIPQLAEVFLKEYFHAGQIVIDPFAGSGTTLVQANEMGINSIGCDVSAFNVMLCDVKLSRYDTVGLLETEVLHALGMYSDAGEQSIDNKYLLQWYSDRSRQDLLKYRSIIGDYFYSDVLKIILSRSARSARLTTHFDLDSPKEPQTQPYWCHKHKRECSPVDEAARFIKRYSLDTIKRVEQFADIRTDARATIYHADSRSFEFPFADGVVTSPPYLGLIDYHGQHEYAYQLLGLADKSGDEIGSARSGTGKRAQAEYVSGMSQVFNNVLKSIPYKAPIIVVVADKLGLYDEIASNVGVIVEDVFRRTVNRRTGRRAGEFFEDVIVWRKK